MQIRAVTAHDWEHDFTRLAIYLEDPKALAAFTELVNRALNCWPEAPAELKELGDMLTHGHVTQDYRSQMYSRRDHG